MICIVRRCCFIPPASPSPPPAPSPHAAPPLSLQVSTCLFDVSFNTTGSLSVGEVAALLGSHTLQQLKKECGGLQTLLKNSYQVFRGTRAVFKENSGAIVRKNLVIFLSVSVFVWPNFKSNSFPCHVLVQWKVGECTSETGEKGSPPAPRPRPRPREDLLPLKLWKPDPAGFTNTILSAAPCWLNSVSLLTEPMTFEPQVDLWRRSEMIPDSDLLLPNSFKNNLSDYFIVYKVNFLFYWMYF